MVAPALIGAGIGAGLGLLKARHDRAEAERQAAEQRRIQSVIAAQAPWTKMQADTRGLTAARPDLVSNIGFGALQGFGVGSSDFFNPKDKASAEAGDSAELADEYSPPESNLPGPASLKMPPASGLVSQKSNAPTEILGNNATATKPPVSATARRYPPGYPTWLMMQYGNNVSPGSSGQPAMTFQDTPRGYQVGKLPYR